MNKSQIKYLKWIIVLLFICPLSSIAATEDELKAAFIYNFIKFVSWPENSSNTVNLCVHGNVKNITPYLNLSKKNIVVRKIESLRVLSRCQVLYLAESENAISSDLSKEAIKNSILLIGDEDSFIEKGGMISLIPTGNTMGFEVNYLTIKEANLKISSNVLAIAKRVINE